MFLELGENSRLNAHIKSLSCVKQWFTVLTLIMTLFHAGMPEPGAVCTGALVELSRPIIIASLMCDSHAVVAFLKGLNIPFSLFVNVFYVTTYLRIYVLSLTSTLKTTIYSMFGHLVWELDIRRSSS